MNTSKQKRVSAKTKDAFKRYIILRKLEKKVEKLDKELDIVWDKLSSTQKAYWDELSEEFEKTF